MFFCCCFNIQNSNQSVMQCVGGKKFTYSGNPPFSIEGKYGARVRAITPAGNGSWSNTVAFSFFSVGEFKNNLWLVLP